jgi:hypothetical protein
MATSTKDLLHGIADVLEKVASYVEMQDSKTLRAEKDAKLAAATKLAEQITTVTGETLGADILDKLANLSPEVVNIVQQLSGTGDRVESLGGPPSVKLAGFSASSSPAAAVQAAEERYLNWLTSE